MPARAEKPKPRAWNSRFGIVYRGADVGPVGVADQIDKQGKHPDRVFTADAKTQLVKGRSDWIATLTVRPSSVYVPIALRAANVENGSRRRWCRECTNNDAEVVARRPSTVS